MCLKACLSLMNQETTTVCVQMESIKTSVGFTPVKEDIRLIICLQTPVKREGGCLQTGRKHNISDRSEKGKGEGRTDLDTTREMGRREG